MGEEAMAVLSEAERAFVRNNAHLGNSCLCYGSMGWSTGTLALVLKKAWALPVLVASLIGIVVQMYHSIFISGAMEVYGPGKIIMPIMVLAIGFYLVWLARSAKAKGGIS